MAKKRERNILMGYDGEPITPNDGADLSEPGYLVIAVGGTLKVDVPTDFDAAKARRQTGVTFTVPAGLFPVPVIRVYATGTAATGITLIKN